MAAGGDIDWDSLGTFALTVLVGVATAGVPFVISGFRVLGKGLGARNDTSSDLLVVFGKRLVSDQPDDDYQARLRTAARLATARPRHRILILGGQTGDARLTEAAAGEALLRALPNGAALNIGLEETSVDTLTNLRNVREMLKRADPRPLTLITNRYHLARAAQTAGSLGLAYQLCAAEGIRTALRWSTLIHWPMEAFYVTWFATGKLWATLTRNRRMLARVT